MTSSRLPSSLALEIEIERHPGRRNVTPASFDRSGREGHFDTRSHNLSKGSFAGGKGGGRIHEGADLTVGDDQLLAAMVKRGVVVTPGAEECRPGSLAVPGINGEINVGVGGRLNQLGAIEPDLPGKEHGPFAVRPVDS